MLNVFKALNKMRKVQTKQIHSVCELDELLNHSYMSPKNQRKENKDNISQFEKIVMGGDEEDDEIEIAAKKAHDDSDLEEMRVFNEIKKTYKIFDFVASGDPANIEYIVNCLKIDHDEQAKEVINPKEIDKSRLLVNKLDNNGKSMLYIASIYGNLSMVKLLIEHGADVFYRCQVK